MIGIGKNGRMGGETGIIEWREGARMGHGIEGEDRVIGGLISLLAVIAVLAVAVVLVLPWLDARQRRLAAVVRPRAGARARLMGRGLSGLS